MQLPIEKKEENFHRHKASAERVSRNATRHDTHNGTLENLEVFYALRYIVSILHDCSCTLLLPGIYIRLKKNILKKINAEFETRKSCMPETRCEKKFP